MTPKVLKCLFPWALVGLSAAAASGQGGGVDPGQPGDPNVDCWTACELALREALQPCIGPDGSLDDACAAGAKQVHEACLLACGPPPPPPPPDPAQECVAACDVAFQAALQPCIAADGTIEQDCAARAGADYEACLKICGVGPDPVQLCLLDCDARFQEAAGQCARDDGSIDMDCLTGARETYTECATACGVTVPGEILCGMGCEAAYFSALSRCSTDPALEPNQIDGECAEAAHRAFETCFEACGIEVPKEIACASGCDQSLSAAIAACGEDADCQRTAFAGYDECLRGCGFAIPDLPGPDPCTSTCDRAYGESAAACFDPETGEPDQECLAAVDQRYLACLEGCGVAPGPFPVPPGQQGCLGDCDVVYQKAMSTCIDPAGNVFNPECLEAAERTLAACIAGCGVEIPEDLPGAPTEECSRQCQEKFGDTLRTCILADGSLDEACAALVSQEMEACMGSCSDDTQARILGALARAAASEFLRGDANHDHQRDITDAVVILSFLFTGGDAPGCLDAADANDDGVLNVTDPVVILDFLFRGSGPLPAPAEAVGVDPTADLLDC